MRRLSLLAALLWLCGCESPPPTTTKPSAAPAPPAAVAPMVKSRFPAAERVVALGDVHGDLRAMRTALRLGGLIDDGDRWIGGTAVLVQTGDVLDRGDDEQAIIDLLLALQQQARAAGGEVHLLQGNHELMNVALDFRYVTPGGMRDFADAPGLDLADPRLTQLPAAQRARAAAFLPGGVYARKLATHPVVVVVGDTVYCHGGVLPKYAGDIERINREVAAWLLGSSAAGARVVQLPDSPVWSRHYSDEPDEADCKLLDEALHKLGAARMVVGHTVLPEISSACGGKVWRVDVGMAAHYGGKPQVLELTPTSVRPLKN